MITSNLVQQLPKPPTKQKILGGFKLALGGFKLTKFVSNVPSIPVEVEPNSDNETTNAKDIPTAEKFSHVLGLKWNHSTDTLVVSRGTSPNTDRNVTQSVGRSEFGIRCIRPN